MLNDTNQIFTGADCDQAHPASHTEAEEACDIAKLNEAKASLIKAHPQITGTITDAVELLEEAYHSSDPALRGHARHMVRRGRHDVEGHTMEDVVKTLIMAELDRKTGGHLSRLAQERQAQGEIGIG